MKGRTKRNFKFFVFILILCVIAFGGAMLFSEDDNSLKDFIENLGEDAIKDNYNGFYSYSDDLNGSKTLFKGCILSKINNYILIVNDKFYTYRSSCVGTFALEEGKVKDLDIGVNEERETYYIKYNDKVYYKDYTVTSLDVRNRYKEDAAGEPFLLTDYKLLFKESQYPDKYFDLKNKEIDGLSSRRFVINFKHVKDESFVITIGNSEGTVFYTYTAKDFDSMPDFYPYGAFIVVVEKDETEYKYSNTLKVLSDTGVVYNLSDMFPIVVDGVTLDNNKNVFVSFNKSEMDYRVIISDSKKMCYSDEENVSGVAYYEFKIDYNYLTKSFERPVFVKQYLKSDSCVHINEILGG